jgi:hypothetical protein
MKIYIQSKSGDFNTVFTFTSLADKAESLHMALSWLRSAGGYQTEHRGHNVLVPFEQIEYIRKAEDGD